MSRKLDVAIAEARGYEVNVKRNHLPCYERYLLKRNDLVVDLPYYSTDGNTMLKLIDELLSKGFDVMADSFEASTGEKKFSALFAEEPDNVFRRHSSGAGLSYGKTMPEAVARAAYHALTGKEWSE